MEDIAVGSTFSIWPYVAIGVLILVAIALIGGGLYKLKRFFSRPETVGMTREQLAKRWALVRQTQKQGLMGAKLALFEADTLLDACLKSMMLPGETLGERLKVACYNHQNLHKVWWAHKLRNQLAHDSSFNLTEREAGRALDEFERAFKALNMM